MGMDTDAGGRRLGVTLENDHDGMLGDKDVLPVYDGAGGPPKYFELDAFRSGRTAVGGEGYEGIGAFGRTGFGVESQGAEAASSASLAYPNAPPGDPPSTNVDDLQDHLRSPPVRDEEPGIVAPGLGAPAVPIPVYADSAVDPASSPSPSAQRDASLSPLPS
jgi:catechol 2,3-dioxygenase-like lactoylglutathione lyase family enzyme